MVSFIVIGKNIAPTIEICLNSIVNASKNLRLAQFEIIYIDSRSNDSTMDKVKSFRTVRAISISGAVNAAIARNIGAKEAKYNLLFFLDGDMEVDEQYLSYVIANHTNIIFESGDLVNIFYDEKWNRIDALEHPYFNTRIATDRREFVTGGFFVIRKDIWNSVDGMDTGLRRGQDLDLGLRLCQRDVFLLRKRLLFARHHTISYFNTARFKKMFRSGDYLYPGAIIRKNIFNTYAWKVFLRWYSTFYALIAIVLLSIFVYKPLIILYPLLIVTRALLKKSKEMKGTVFHVISYFLIDINTLIGFLMFFPKSHPLKYKTHDFEV